MSTSSAFDEISENLSFLDDWEDRYRYIIELGQTLPPLREAERNAANKVHGCTSQVWLVTEPRSEGGQTVIGYRGESDAMIVKGLVAVLLALYSDRPAGEIADLDALPILDDLGLREHLSTQRANGLAAMVQRIRTDAAAIAKAA